MYIVVETVLHSGFRTFLSLPEVPFSPLQSIPFPQPLATNDQLSNTKVLLLLEFHITGNIWYVICHLCWASFI